MKDWLHDASTRGETETVKRLIDKGGFPPDLKDRDGVTPLQNACRFGHFDIAEYLVEKGADVNHGYGLRWTALRFASLEGHAAIVELLLSHGASIDCSLGDGATPLHMACAYDHVDVVRMLLEAGADPRATNNLGEMPADFIDDKTSSAGTLLVELLEQFTAETDSTIPKAAAF
jgi:ankyrin repeat protein